MRLLSTLGLLALSATLQADAIFAPKASLDLMGAYASVDRGAGSSSMTGDLMLSPAWVWLQGPSLVIGLKGNLSGQQQALEENTLFARSAALGASVDWNQPAGAGRVPLRVEALRSLSSRTANEAWGKGLYDWEQFTASTGYRRDGSDWKAAGSLFGGHRGYPNYRDRSAVLAGGKGYYFKDYDFGGGSASYVTWLGAGWSGELKYNLELRGFGDAYITRKDGTVDLGMRQAEDMHSVGFSAARLKREEEWGYQAEAAYTLLNSNQGYFDTGSNVYTPSADAFDAESLALKLVWNAFHRIPGLGMDLMGSIQNRNSRLPIRGADGSYALGLQSDLTYRGRLSAIYGELPWGLQALAVLDLSRVTSNQGFAAYGNPEYTLFNASLGLSWAWSRY
jgi:hypothetical protein